jgi:hypothetical protein
MKTIIDQIDKGAVVVTCEIGAGYVETQDLMAQIKRREGWRNDLMALARRGAETSWYDIKKYLPKDQEFVDIYLTEKEVRIANVIYNADTGCDDAHFYDEDMDIIYDQSEVSHWMYPPMAPAKKQQEPEEQYQNDYKCPRCKHEWSETWTCGCDSECPACQLRNISPIRSIPKE